MHTSVLIKALALYLFSGAMCLYAQPTKVADAESASHEADAASLQVSGTYPFEADGITVLQLNLPVLSHYSYMVLSDGEAIVIDPARDPNPYLIEAKKRNAIIKGVALTHSHADFVAGHREVAHVASCPILVNSSAKAEYEHKAVNDGTEFRVGRATLRFLATPGHTPDSMCIHLSPGKDTQGASVLFTGDTLFVGSIGRPDLLEGKMSAASLASMMFDTWTSKLSKLPDHTLVLPAHGAGSLCGAHLSDKPNSTIGEERLTNVYLQHKARGEFVASVLEGLPEAPQYFKHNAALNRVGPKLVEWDAPLPETLPASVELTNPAKHYVVDIRSAADYAAGHIPNSVNIGLRGRFETWVGIMVPWDAPLVLFGSRGELTEALRRLHRVGYRANVITPETWTQAKDKEKLRLTTNTPIAPIELHRRMLDGTAPILVDVRLASEWMGLRIGTVVNLPLSDLDRLATKLDPAQPAVTVCNSAYRSSMAVGILERHGFQNVSSLQGGSEAWLETGLPVFGAEARTPQAVPTAKRIVQLPERISTSDLRTLMHDLPGTFDLVDIRPADQFSDYSIPGATRVDLPDLVSDASYLTGAGPLIILDRDGSLAMAVGGILSQKTQRSIKVLHGGLDQYWQETELRLVVRETRLEPKGSGRSVTTRPAQPRESPSGASQTPPERKPTAKKKSAGC